MNTSTYYNLKLVEGTDIVNPLTTDVPNYETIDEQMHNNSIAGVTLATEVANGKVHALIRENNECAVIRFVATSNWTFGDTITVDGIPVVAVLPSGEALDEGAYVVNANVLCILTGTNLTVYAVKNRIDNANEIPYNDTNVGAELTKLNESLESCFQSVSNGKTLVASAITDQGIETDATATFEVMANNIRRIERTQKIDFNVFASNQEIKPIFVAPKSGYYNIYITPSISGNVRIYKYNGEVQLFNMDMGANQEKIATVNLSTGDTAGVWINNSSGAYLSGYTIIPS